jgi:hypothetical protein
MNFEYFLQFYEKKESLLLSQDNVVADDTDDFSPLAFFPPNPSNLSLNSLNIPPLEDSFIELPKLPKNIVIDPVISKCFC